MTTPHKHADILRAIADGKEIEYKRFDTGTWEIINDFVNPIVTPNSEFRVKANFIVTEFGNIPRPFRPEIGDFYYTANPNNGQYIYSADTYDEFLVDQGFCWKTKEEAKQALAVLKNMMWS